MLAMGPLSENLSVVTLNLVLTPKKILKRGPIAKPDLFAFQKVWPSMYYIGRLVCDLYDKICIVIKLNTFSFYR